MMKRILVVLFIIGTSICTVSAQSSEAWKKQYRAFETKENDLIHTKVDAHFDFDHSYLLGKVWLTIKPHFYTTDSLWLDAKQMDIHVVEMVKSGKNIPLSYEYDSMRLKIHLDKTYNNNETYTVYIDYTAKPEETNFKGSRAITDAKGLYFINPKGEEKNKPTQVWTQGETESNSVWVPIIDKPDQKTTDEIYMTVPDKYVTLSNGKLVSQTKNADSTRTDYWKMELPHAPYLIFMGIGDYAVVKDTYKGKEVNYYVEKDFKDVAKKIFGLTPEMMGFYSRILGVEYPWNKYSQITARDYVSGAMENTTATLHMERAQQSARELVDGNNWESTIAHELFHQWFGDLVTCESWSNLTVNESFANYSETLWDEYKHGKDAGDAQNYADMQGYLMSGSSAKVLVRHYYADKEDMFDGVSYNKGGRILHMLRNYVGDSAFFKSLNLYLTTNKFGNGSAHKLRLAFETVTGKDLNWYFNQWYFGAGHPKLDITYSYNDTTNKAIVVVSQTQTDDKIFKLPVAIDVYIGKDKKRYNVWAENKSDTFSFDVSAKPDLINFDGDKILLCEKKDHHTISEYAFMYKYAGKYMDRREALTYATKHMSEPQAYEIVKAAVTDPYFDFRKQALENLADSTLSADLLKKVENIAANDDHKRIQAIAIELLGKQKDSKYKSLFLKAAKDSSYSVAGAGLTALAEVDDASAVALLPELKKDAKGKLKNAIEGLEILTKTEADFDDVYKSFNRKSIFDKFGALSSFTKYLGKINNTDNYKKGIDLIVTVRDRWSGFSAGLKERVNKSFLKLINDKELQKAEGSNAKAMDAQIAYTKEQLKEKTED